LVLLGHDPQSAQRPHGVTLDALRRCTREQLLDCARRLGLTGVAKLNKDGLAGRVQLALEQLPGSPRAHLDARETPDKPGDTSAEQPNGEQNGEQNGQPNDDDTLASFPAKFDLGPESENRPTPQHIPWSYGQNRVTAMVVDPEKMFVYWECTDAAIDSARRGLGAAGHDAWLTLRVYDISGRLFDGTNAHSYFDHAVARWDRQWFFEIGKPTSVACVELGLKSAEGYFVKISRSGRVEFPRREPVGGNQIEWLTVQTASGAAGQPIAGAHPMAGGGAFGDGGGGGVSGHREPHGVPEWANGGGGAGPGGFPIGTNTFERRWEWREEGGVHGEWRTELASVEWIGPMVRTAWEAGPFTYPVQSPAYIEEWNDGSMTVRSENGKVHIVYGPWQVVIRGIGARAERRVLATWEIRRSWATTVETQRSGTTWRPLAPGSSEWVAQGGSERSWMGGSELRLGGASEMFMLGASELRFAGASETLYSGASEWLMRGASERMYAGASEWAYAGASERMYAGASERMYGGASEKLLGGASEQSRGYPTGLGASENRPASPESRAPGDGTQPMTFPVKR
jgi:hypothetical protein